MQNKMSISIGLSRDNGAIGRMWITAEDKVSANRRKPGQERYRDVRLVAARQTQTTITAGETADESP
jgi:hypothetical protein